MGYWHITALATCISILSSAFNSQLIIILGLIWLTLLKVFKRLNLLPTIVSLAALIFFSFYIPTQPETLYTTTTEQQQISGQIVQAVGQTPKTIEFVILDKDTKQKYSVLHFNNNRENINPAILQTIKYGANCSIRGKVNIPKEARNPGQFDFKNYLVDQGITAQFIVEHLNHIQCTGESIFHSLFQLRQHLLDKVENIFSKETTAWLQALVLGDRSQLDDQTIQLFQRWGLSHLLAISGLHVGIIVASIYFVCVRLGIMTKESTELLLLSFLPVYAIVAGSEPSVLRAILMVMIFLIINRLGLNLQMQDTISIVFLLLIIFNPYIIYHIGFQFSFLVTFGLILSREWISQTKSMAWQLLIISFVSQMVILPLQINYFHTFQPLSIILNFFVVPYFSLFVIPTMFFALPVMYISPWIINSLIVLFEAIHQQVMASLFFIDKHLYYPYVIGEFPVIFIIFYYVILGLLFVKMQDNHIKDAVKYGFLLVSLIITLVLQPYFTSKGMITMLDVGQGDAFIIELPYRRGVIFVDAAATVEYENFTVTDDIYMYTIKPYLYSRGIQSVDAIILSHAHVDHNGSSQYIIEEMDVPLVIISEYYEATKEEKVLWETSNVQVKRLVGDDSFTLKGQVFNVLSPMIDERDTDDNSLVLHSSFGEKSWVFTGDIGKRIERKIKNTYEHLSIDVLKVAHHGSKTSTDESFIEHFRPKYALISVGENNSYGHPNDEVIQTLKDEEIHILRTDRYGAVQYIFTEKDGTFFTYLP